jgi:hypothetical protein
MKVIGVLILLALLPVAGVAQRPARKPVPTKKAMPQISIVLRSKADRKKLDEFLSNHEREVVSVDVFLLEDDLKSVHSVDEKQLYVDLSYKDREGNPTGSEWLIELKDGDNDLMLDYDLRSAHGDYEYLQQACSY